MDISIIDTVLDSTYKVDEYPVLHNQSVEWRQSKPLDGLHVIDATPIFRNTLAKYKALIEAGAKLTVGISDLMPCDPKIVEMLGRIGIPTIRPEQTPVSVDIILDCAAVFSHWKPRIGFSELTRSGTDKFTDADRPVFIADNGRIKRIETCIGTGESFFRAMAQLGYTEWRDKSLVIFGSGKVGTGIILHALRNGAHTTVVTDPSTAPKYENIKIIDYRDTAQVEQAVTDAYVVVTATGRLNAMESCCAPEVFVDSKAILANMGVEDEYGVMIPEHRVLRGKMPLNFILEEPTHLKYIDATMALHNQGAIYILQSGLTNGIIEPPKEMEQALLEVCRLCGCIGDELGDIE